MLKKLMILFAALLFVFAIFNYLVMPLYVNHYETVKVPKLTGMNFVEAKNLVEQSGLDIKQADVKYDEKIPIGQVLDQNPPPDVMVKSGRRVYVTICGGEQLAEVPNLKGRSLRDAKFALEQRGLRVGETVRKNTNEFPQEVVLSQVVQPGSKVKRNTAIELIISDGPIVGDLRVPMVVGKNLDEAKKIITEGKLKVGKITYQTNNEIPAGQIVDQYPKADKSANESTSVELFVARKKVVIQKEEEEGDMSVEGNADLNATEKKPSTPKGDTKDQQKENTKSTAKDQTKETDKPKDLDKSKEKQPVTDKDKTTQKEQSPKEN
jgi:serine/threonine-protein kinase